MPDYKLIDNSERIEFYSSGLRCLVKKGPLGSWNGYVGVEKTHPLYKVGQFEDEIPEALSNISVHGGITYSELSNPTQEISHLHDTDAGIWWFGFDTAHYGDLVPGTELFLDGIYRDETYVRNEVKSLAEQLAEVTK